MKINWTPEALALLAPCRALHPEKPAAKADAAAVLQACFKQAKEMADNAAMKARNPAQGIAMLQRVIAASEAHLNGQSAWDAEVEGVRLLICDSAMGSIKKEVVIDTWVEGPGLLFAIQAVLAGLKWRLNSGYLVAQAELEYRDQSLCALSQRFYARLRQHIAAAPLEKEKELIAWATQALPSWSVGERGFVLYFLPEAPFANEVALEIAALNSQTIPRNSLFQVYNYPPKLLTCNLSLETVKKVIPTYSNLIEPFLNVLYRHGPAAASCMDMVLERLYVSSYSNDWLNSFRTLYSIISDVDAIKPFIHLLPAKGIVDLWPLLADRPDEALHALAPQYERRGAERAFYAQLIDRLLAEFPEALPKALNRGPALPQEARAFLEERLSLLKGNFAPTESLPAIFQNPPWKEKKSKKAKAITKALSPQPTTAQWFPDAIAEGGPALGSDEWLNSFFSNRYSPFTPEEEAMHLANFDAWLANPSQPCNLPRGWRLSSFSPQAQQKIAQLKLWDAMYIYDRRDLVSLCSRWQRVFGLQLLPLILKVLSEGLCDVSYFLNYYYHPEFVPRVIMLWRRRKPVRKQMMAWMLRHANNVAMELIPVAMAKPSTSDAERALRALCQQGAREQVRQAAAAYQAETEVMARIDQDPLLILPASMPDLEVAWGALPPIKLRNGQLLNKDAWEVALTMIRISTQSDPYAGLEILKEICDPVSMAQLARTWHRMDDKAWTYTALAVFGDDAVARMISKHLRTGDPAPGIMDSELSILLSIGSDVALIELSRVAEKSRKDKVKRAAKTKLKELAEERGLSELELEDRLVPDLDLEADGGKVLDLGSRTLKIQLDETLQPYVCDSAGQRLAKFPPATKADDKAKYKEASETWKSLKSALEVLSKTQISRLQRAFVEGRHWEPEAFKCYLVEHPLMQHLSRRLLWQYQDGQQSTYFRVTEDGSLADQQENGWVLPEEGQIQLVHPIEMAPEALAEWTRIFGDYQIAQPFDQLSRPTFAILPEEKEERSLKRFEDMEVPGKVLLGILEQAGWHRGNLDYGTHLYNWHIQVSGKYASISVNPAIDMSDLEARHHCSISLSEAFGTLSARAFSEIVRPLEACRR